MPYRILVDENLDPQTALFLQRRGHDALHVQRDVGKGATDSDIAAYAREHGRVVLTNDRDFLDPERSRGLTVLMVPDNEVTATEIVETVDELATHVPDPAELGRVTWL